MGSTGCCMRRIGEVVCCGGGGYGNGEGLGIVQSLRTPLIGGDDDGGAAVAVVVVVAVMTGYSG